MNYKIPEVPSLTDWECFVWLFVFMNKLNGLFPHFCNIKKGTKNKERYHPLRLEALRLRGNGPVFSTPILIPNVVGGGGGGGVQG